MSETSMERGYKRLLLRTEGERDAALTRIKKLEDALEKIEHELTLGKMGLSCQEILDGVKAIAREVLQHDTTGG